MKDWRFWRRKQRHADLDDEIAFDLAADAEERMRRGGSRAEAEIASHRDFGNVALMKENVRESWGWTWLGSLHQDLRYAARALRRNPIFTAMAVLSLALGIGANTAIYSVMDAVLFRPLPVRNPGELVIPSWRGAKAPPPGVHDVLGDVGPAAGGGWTSRQFSWDAYEAFAGKTGLFSSLMAWKSAGRLNVVVQGEAEVNAVVLVSGNFFTGLGVAAAVGRLLTEGDNVAGGSQVAVLGNGYWRTRFAGDPSAVGRKLAINKVPFTIIGVAAPEFSGIVPGTAPAIYIPIVNWPTPDDKGAADRFARNSGPHVYWVDMIGRLRPNVTAARAQLELGMLFHQLALAAAEAAGVQNSHALPLLSLETGGGVSGINSLRSKYAKPLVVLMTMVLFILAIACANITSLLLARAAVRRREIAVRLSLGASRLRLLRQLLTESVLLALLGGLGGIGVAAAGIRFLLSLLASGRDDFQLSAGIDWPVLLFTAAVSFLTGLVFGLAPAMAATRVSLIPALQQSSAASPGGSGRGPGLSPCWWSAKLHCPCCWCWGPNSSFAPSRISTRWNSGTTRRIFSRSA